MLCALSLAALGACETKTPDADAGPPDAPSADSSLMDASPLPDSNLLPDVVATDCTLIGCTAGELRVVDAMGNPVTEFSGTFSFANGVSPMTYTFSCNASSMPVADMTQFSCLGGGRLRLSYDATVATQLRVEAGTTGTWQGATSEVGTPITPNGPACGPACNGTLTVTVRP